MDYLEYFGLREEPFSHAPLSEFYYASHQHTAALERLTYSVRAMRGLALLVGDIGRGKTTLARRLLDMLPEEEFEAALLVIVHAGITPSWLLKRLAVQLGVEQPEEDKLSILSQLYQRLVQIHESGKKAVVLIDEAQMLGTRELMEEFRGLLNLEVPGQKLVSFVFFGLPELESNLHLDSPLAQRVAMRIELRPLDLEDTKAYVTHRLRMAGAQREVLTEGALEAIHRFTGGVPRLINTLCDNVLLEMFFEELFVAEPALVEQVAQNLRLVVHSTGPGARAVQPPPSSQSATAPSVVMPAVPAAGRAAWEADQRREAAQGVDRATMVSLADDLAARVAAEAPTQDMLRRPAEDGGVAPAPDDGSAGPGSPSAEAGVGRPHAEGRNTAGAPAPEAAAQRVVDDAPRAPDDAPAAADSVTAEAGGVSPGPGWEAIELAGDLLGGSDAPPVVDPEPPVPPFDAPAGPHAPQMAGEASEGVAGRVAAAASFDGADFDFDVEGFDPWSPDEAPPVAQKTDGPGWGAEHSEESGGSAVVASVAAAVLEHAKDVGDEPSRDRPPSPQIVHDPYYDDYDEGNSEPIALPEYVTPARPPAREAQAWAEQSPGGPVSPPEVPPQIPRAAGSPSADAPIHAQSPPVGGGRPEPLDMAALLEPEPVRARGTQPPVKSSTAQPRPEPKRDRKTVRTSSGQTLDMAEIDDLLADVIGRR